MKKPGALCYLQLLFHESGRGSGAASNQSGYRCAGANLTGSCRREEAKGRAEKESRDRLDEEAALRVVGREQVHVHLVQDYDLAAPGNVQMQRHGGACCAGKPEMLQQAGKPAE
jgi:hypothetical protein